MLDALRLNLIPGVGPRIRQALLDAFGSAAAVLAARGEQLQQVPGVGPKLALSILDHRDPAVAEGELARCRELGVRLILAEDEDYPRSLAKICDPPGVLYCRGTIEPRDNLAVAIVGSRRCTHYGRRQAERLASTLARAGVTIVSGLARGIDGIAHQAALTAGGRTIAVLGTGLAGIYPPEHAPLADQVAAHGALLSELPLDQQPMAGLFPQRNRIISGLAHGVIIVEASRTSGALHTARHANEQGREVFAVPGPIDSLASEGCHGLIRDGATLVHSADDVLESLGPLIAPVPHGAAGEVHSPRELTLNDQELCVLKCLTTEPMHVDEVLRGSELEASRVLATLTVLEMKRMVRRLPGGYLVRSPG
ncbi:MAG TPA: DNA-processing protein DprA [Planctomycetaceae bacterium]|nr:DNA-processing protein DprA [Planctomycetaceae bacterium]